MQNTQYSSIPSLLTDLLRICSPKNQYMLFEAAEIAKKVDIITLHDLVPKLGLYIADKEVFRASITAISVLFDKMFKTFFNVENAIDYFDAVLQHKLKMSLLDFVIMAIMIKENKAEIMSDAMYNSTRAITTANFYGFIDRYMKHRNYLYIKARDAEKIAETTRRDVGQGQARHIKDIIDITNGKEPSVETALEAVKEVEALRRYRADLQKKADEICVTERGAPGGIDKQYTRILYYVFCKLDELDAQERYESIVKEADASVHGLTNDHNQKDAAKLRMVRTFMRDLINTANQTSPIQKLLQHGYSVKEAQSLMLEYNNKYYKYLERCIAANVGSIKKELFILSCAANSKKI